ncbi:hypothetical protein [Bradyrhizobium diversitatis]|uniref:hypothetical protein n=1 Tax=Bradyrhizobium diversitatis TaxID=2755406 RepID=UPI001FE581E0|nr:hypothetical protein [Bradyrhizobium diversitatis]
MRELSWRRCKGQRTGQRPAQDTAFRPDRVGQEQQRGVPTNAVYETMYGSKSVPAHGTREMPIWGERFNPIVSLPHAVDPTYWQKAGPQQSPEVVVRTRILAVIDYLNRIQQK